MTTKGPDHVTGGTPAFAAGAGASPRRTRRLAAAFAGLTLVATLGWLAPVASASTVILVNTVNQEINGDGFCSLQEAIYAANLDDNVAPDSANPGTFFDTACVGGSGVDTIELPPMGVFTFADPIDDPDNFVGPAVTPIITSAIIIEGRGARLERVASTRLTRAFAVGPTGDLDLREVHVKGFAIRGGDGGRGGGGGGLGAGGAIYIHGGSLLVQWSTFEGNAASGGNGGDENNADGGGGGGGVFGDGGNGDVGGGGGGGSRGNGGDSRTVGVDSWGGGGGGRLTSATNEVPGEPCGGAGGESGFGFGRDGSAPSCSGGGGGGGSGTSDVLPGNGRSGLYGGGGGGGGTGALLGGDDGGDGGFGGGGGGSDDNDGGDGGFGGGGGKGDEIVGSGQGQGGTFAGDGGIFAGGGGAGLGGAIFGYLADIRIVNSTFVANEARQGESGTICGLESCGAGANDGRGAGGAIFTVAGNLTVESSTIAANGAFTVTNGGGGGIVVYDPIGTDEATLQLRNSIIAGNGSHECYTRNSVTTSGSAGNIITDNTDSNTPDSIPCPGVIPDPAGSTDPGLGALTLNAPGRTPTMAIGVSSSAINRAVGTSPLDDQRGVPRPQGALADIGAYEYEAPAAVPPVTTIALTPSTPNGSNDWYDTAVGVSVTASDFDGDLGQTRCALDPAVAPSSFDDMVDVGCTLSSVAADGNHTTYAASRDLANNTESPVISATFKIDKTAPTLSPTLNVTSVTIGQTGVVASANATDDTSGVATWSCDPVDTSTPGVHTVGCTATDNAGNTSSGSVTFVVEYNLLGFFSPVPGSKWRAGQTVPVKVAIGGAAGRLSDAEASALATACRVTFSATGVQAVAAQCLRYDAASDQFQFNWKLKKSPLGGDMISVSISYPGSSLKTTLSETIVISK